MRVLVPCGGIAKPFSPLLFRVNPWPRSCSVSGLNLVALDVGFVVWYRIEFEVFVVGSAGRTRRLDFVVAAVGLRWRLRGFLENV